MAEQPPGTVTRLKAWPKPILDRDGNPKRAPAPVTEPEPTTKTSAKPAGKP